MRPKIFTITFSLRFSVQTFPTGNSCEFAERMPENAALLLGAPYNGGTADSPNVCGNLAVAAGASRTPPPTMRCGGFAEHL